jgi:ribonucleoside-diphosphate reductase alpha chain
MEKYSEAVVMDEAIKYFNGDELAASVWVNKYALRDNGHWLEKTPDDMHRRLANEFARIEANYPNSMSVGEIYELLKDYRYVVPQGSPMSGIGNDYQTQSLSNCFTLPGPLDSYGGICKTDQEMVQLMKRRGGVGFDISAIRPRGMLTKNAARTTDGIGCFMERYSNSTREVAQNGRRGALMLTISIRHPEIRSFINIKRDTTKVTGANISIRIDDEFMRAVDEDEEYELYWPVDAKTDEEKQVVEKVDAREIWNEIVSAARDNGEPGVLFWDTAIKNSPADSYADVGYKTVCVNPCSEIFLSEYDSCRLLLLNLTSYVVGAYGSSACFDFGLFDEHVHKAQRLMDDLVDLELEKIDRILYKIEADPEPDDVKLVEHKLWQSVREACVNGRRTGLGVTGLGDTIAALGFKYGTEHAIAIVDNIYRQLAISAYKSSCSLAKERGAFPVFDREKEVDNDYLNRVLDCDANLANFHAKYGRRNIALLTTAPCGSVSTQTQTTSGIEPVFMLKYKRRRKLHNDDAKQNVDFVDELGDKWQEYEVCHHGLQRWMEATGKEDITQSPYGS